MLPFLFSYLIALITLLGICAGGYWVFSGFIFSFVLHPLIDLLFGDLSEVPVHKASPRAFSVLLWMYLPVQLTIFIFVLNNLKPEELLGTVLSTGAMAGGIGITVAHELVHRRERWERGIGVGLLLMVNYAHFRVEHVFGHHKHVATPLDPATARKGESIIRFFPRSVVGQWLNAWRLEAKKKNFLNNRLTHYTFLGLIILALTHYFFGILGLAFFLGQSLVAVVTLEATNYIEHFGLSREEISPGVYAPVKDTHSWDTNYRMTNWFLFNLGRHAHHHTAPTVPYENLKSSGTKNKLRYGYSTEVLLALIGKNTGQ